MLETSGIAEVGVQKMNTQEIASYWMTRTLEEHQTSLCSFLRSWPLPSGFDTSSGYEISQNQNDSMLFAPTYIDFVKGKANLLSQFLLRVGRWFWILLKPGLQDVSLVCGQAWPTCRVWSLSLDWSVVSDILMVVRYCRVSFNSREMIFGWH